MVINTAPPHSICHVNDKFFGCQNRFLIQSAGKFLNSTKRVKNALQLKSTKKKHYNNNLKIKLHKIFKSEPESCKLKFELIKLFAFCD